MDFKLSLWLCINYDVLWFEEQCAAGLARPTAKRSDTQSVGRPVVAAVVTDAGNCAIIHGMKLLAADNYGFERLISGEIL